MRDNDTSPASPVSPSAVPTLDDKGIQRVALVRLVIGSVIISTAPVFIKLADVGPDAAGFWRMLFASMALSVWIVAGRDGWQLPPAARKYVIGGGIFLGLDFMCWHRSIDLIGPGLSTLLGNFQIFFTALFSWLLLKERITPVFGVALALAVTGLFLIAGLDLGALEGRVLLGLGLGIATAFFYSGLILNLKQAMSLPGTDNKSAMLVISVSCTLFMALTTRGMKASFVIPDTGSLLALLGAGILCSTLAWALISNAMRVLPATLTGLVLLLQPALALVWDVLLFNRPTGLIEILGVLLILMGIFLGSQRSGT